MAYDYTWLTTQIASFLNRADVYGSIPDFIGLAEIQIRRRLAQAGIQGGVTRATTTINAEFETPPTDFGGPIAMTIQDPVTLKWLALEPDTPTGIATIKGDREATSAIPDRFAVVGGSFQFSPTPDQAYTVDLQYWANLTALSTSNTTNWALTAYPDVYLYGALCHAAPYVRDLGDQNVPAPISQWRAMFETACQEIIDAERRKRGPMFTPSFRATDVPTGRWNRRSFNINTGL